MGRNAAENYDRLRSFVLSQGAALFGVADLGRLEPQHVQLSPRTLSGIDRAVCFAYHLSDRILEDLVDRPTKLYFFHYQRVNILLDEIGLRLTELIQSLGAQAIPIPASQVVDWQRQSAHLSHKHAAAAAGLGWIGRNNLLVTPRYGARVRLATVLTDLPLEPDEPLPWGCGDCYECLPACPAGAIKERREDFDHVGCYEQIRAMVKAAGIRHDICGLCVKACRGRR